MKLKNLAVIFLSLAIVILSLANARSQTVSGDYPLLSQGDFIPPPPPPGYSYTLPPMEAVAAPAGNMQPNLPVLPETIPAPQSASVEQSATTFTESGAADVPDSARFTARFAQSQTTQPVVMPLITQELANNLKRLLRSLKTMRSVADKPESAEELRRIQLTGRVCADLLGYKGFPAPSRFVASGNDKVLRDRSHEAVEYRFYGDFDNRVNGWIKPVKTAIFLDLVFDGRSRRRTHIRSQFTRTGPMTGGFYAYSWDAFGNPWKMQGTLENLFVHDDGLPAGGNLKVYGVDPAGKAFALNLDFPVKVHGEAVAEKADTRHREGKRVSIGN